jgi:hypothetical protein|tara:strand:- start:203 stop:379 length:177 start_codon:yes stop_codon:yes gene_type:complete
MGKWTEGRPEKTTEFINDLSKLKELVFQQLSELKSKRSELVQDLKEKEQEMKEKGTNG